MITTTQNHNRPDWSAAYCGKTVLITGATGYIGSALVHALRDVAEHTMLLIHPQSYNMPSLDDSRNTTIVAGDLADAHVWQHALPGVDVVFHLASYRHYFGYQPNAILDLSVNATSMLQLLEWCRQEKLSPKIIFASSSTLAGNSDTLPIDETVPDDPPTLYAIHKSTAERYLQLYWREHGISSVSLRLANVYGPSPHPDPAKRNTLNLMIKRALQGGPLLLFRNHTCLRDYLFIDDTVRAFLAAGACEAQHNGAVFMIGSGVGCSIGDTIELIADRAAARIGERPLIMPQMDVPIEPVGLRQFVADISRFHTATGWTPNVSLVEGVDCTIGYFLSKEAVHAADCPG